LEGESGEVLQVCLSGILTLTLILTGVAMAVRPDQLSLRAAGFSANENGGTAQVVFDPQFSFRRPFTVDYATQDGSRSERRLRPTNGTIRFVRGQTNATITVRILDDNIFEGLETFTVALSNPTAGATIGPRSTTTVTIVDDESVTPGRLDLQFDPGRGADDTVFTIHSLEGNGLLMGGRFTTVNGVSHNGIARLNSNGSLDAASLQRS